MSRQLDHHLTYLKLSEDAKNDHMKNTKFQLKSSVGKHFYKGNCSFKEAKFLLSNEGYNHSKFDSILTDLVCVIRILEERKFNLDCFLLTIAS